MVTFLGYVVGYKARRVCDYFVGYDVDLPLKHKLVIRLKKVTSLQDNSFDTSQNWVRNATKSSENNVSADAKWHMWNTIQTPIKQLNPTTGIPHRHRYTSNSIIIYHPVIISAHTLQTSNILLHPPPINL